MGLFSMSKGWSVAKIGILPDNYRKEFASALSSKHFEPVLIEELDEEDYDYTTGVVNSFPALLVE